MYDKVTEYIFTQKGISIWMQLVERKIMNLPASMIKSLLKVVHHLPE